MRSWTSKFQILRLASTQASCHDHTQASRTDLEMSVTLAHTQSAWHRNLLAPQHSLDTFYTRTSSFTFVQKRASASQGVLVVLMKRER